MLSLSSRFASETNSSGGSQGRSRWQSAEILLYCIRLSSVLLAHAIAGHGWQRHHCRCPFHSSEGRDDVLGEQLDLAHFLLPRHEALIEKPAEPFEVTL